MIFGITSSQVIFYVGNEFYIAPALVVIKDDLISDVFPLSELDSLESIGLNEEDIENYGDLVIMAG